MDVKQAIAANLGISEFITSMYLEDLKDEELLIRPVNGCNHIAWQLGHLIEAERNGMSKIAPGKEPELPAGFGERYKRGTAANDDPGGYLTKAEYLKLAKQVRAGSLKILEAITPTELDDPVTGVPPMVKTKGELFLLLSQHWMMHAGQWAVIRRKTGRPAMF